MLTFIDGEPPPQNRGRVDGEPLYINLKSFQWTKEEIEDAVRVGLDRLYLDDTELDEYMANGQKLHQVARRVKREQKLIDEAEYEAMKARYR